LQVGQVGQLSMTMRLDRVDSIASGGDVLIDYKTGEADINKWQGDRLDEPQLPMYLMTAAPTESIAIVAFAKLKRSMALGFTGVAESGEVAASIPGIDAVNVGRAAKLLKAASWQMLVADWQRAVNALADEFVAGNAVVNPKYGSQTCAYCDLQSLCRVHEQRATELPDE
jgi:ATP-dependent helicase/nuclease subunit B